MITIKEEFVGCNKWERATMMGGSDAIVLWLAMKAHAATHLTDGFVSDEDMRTLRGSPKRQSRALKALMQCGRLNPDGTRGAGLVDHVEHGFQLHNYLEHAESRERILERRRLASERKERHKRNAPGMHPERVPEHAPDAGQSASGAPTRADVSSPAQPSPEDLQPDNLGAKDLEGSARPEAPPEHAPTQAHSDWDGSPDESMCPADIAERAESLGVLRELANKLPAPLPSVVDSAREFAGYWTIGAGAGQRRRHWMRRLREHIRRSHREGRLKAPGAIEHEAHGAQSELVQGAAAGRYGVRARRWAEAAGKGDERALHELRLAVEEFNRRKSA